MDIKTLENFFHYRVYLSDPQILVDAIIRIAKTYLPAEQIPEIQRAYEYARDAHAGQERLSGEAYIVHAVRSTEFLMQIKPDLETIQACFLHDVIEDTEVTEADIAKAFGEEVANLCEGLVKVSKIKYQGEDRHLETIKKTFLAMAKDLRVIFVKLCDRIHNIQTLTYHPNPVKQQKIAQETMKIYVPIAKRLGLYQYQLYLENGAFKILHEQEFDSIFSYLKKYFENGEKYISKGNKLLTGFLHKEGVHHFEVTGRIKSPYRVYEKLEKKYKTEDIGEVMDLLAFRVVTPTVGDCYMTLGIIHKHYTPLIKKIKDYIAVPKSNGYQSIHTTVLGMFAFPVEIQIRTPEMDEVAEHGVAAHFAYSEQNSSIKVSETQSEWIKKLQTIVGGYKETDDKEKFKQDLRIEVLDKRIYLYTPKGDVLELPYGSSVLDFAFMVHTDIGLRFKNALVNGHIKPISFRPNTGDVITINIFKNKYSANKHWLDFLHTVGAKSHLNRFLKTEQRVELLKKATGEVNDFLTKWSLPKIDSNDDRIVSFYGKAEFEKKLLELIDKKLTPGQMVKAVYPEQWKKITEVLAPAPQVSSAPVVSSKLSGTVIIDGDKVSNYSLCPECAAHIGDRIIAKTSKDGIKIHTLDCKSLKTISFDKLLEAHWEGSDVHSYSVSIELRVLSKYSNLFDILSIFSDLHIVILEVSIKNNGDGTSSVFLESEFSNPAKISFLLNSLKKFDDSIKLVKKGIA